MFPGLVRHVSGFSLWGGICGIFSFFIATGNLLFGTALLVLLLLYIAVLQGPQLLLYFWLLGQPVFFVFFNQILKVLPFITMERMLLVILLVMMVLKNSFVKQHKPRPLAIEVLIFVYLSYALSSLIAMTTAVTLRQDLWFFMQYAIPMLLFIVSRRIQWSERELKVLFASMTVAGVFLTLIGVMQVFFGIDIFTMDYQSVTSGHVGRAHGTFSNAHTYTVTLLIFFILTLFQYSLYRGTLAKFLLVSAMLVMSLGIFLGQTRAPWLGFVLMLAIVFLHDRNVRPVVLFGVCTCVAASLIALPFVIDHLDGVIQRILNTETIGGRMAVWATSLNMLFHNPVLGVGFGADSFLIHKNEYIMGIGSLTAQDAVYLGVPHNEYLHVAVLLGVVGLVIFLAILYQMLILSFGIHADKESSSVRRLLAVYVGAITAGMLFNSLFSDTYLQDYVWMLTYFLLGLVVAMSPDFGRGLMQEKEAVN